MQKTDWPLQPLANECQQSGQSFKTGQKVLSCLFLDEEGILQRQDYLEETYNKRTDLQKKTLGWWNQIIKDKSSKKITRAESDKSTEELFLSLYDEDNKVKNSPEQALLKYLLAIALERRRILCPLEQQSNKNEQCYVHTKSKKEYLVNKLTVDQDTLIKVQKQLNQLL